jgi:hypothetical protein
LFYENKNTDFVIEEASNKSFGLLFSFVFFIIATYLYLVANYFFALILTIIAILLFYLAVSKDYVFQSYKIIWLKFGFFIGKITTPIIMFLIFTSLFVPVGLILFVFKLDILDVKKSKGRKTTWKIRRHKIETMDKQF